MQLKMRFFASLREQLGAGDSLEFAEGATVAEVRDQLIARGSAFEAALGRGRTLRAARNQVLCDEDQVLADGDELAFFPPVTGG